jgi:hypothetical protein
LCCEVFRPFFERPKNEFFSWPTEHAGVTVTVYLRLKVTLHIRQDGIVFFFLQATWNEAKMAKYEKSFTSLLHQYREKRWQPPWLASVRAHHRRTWVWVG